MRNSEIEFIQINALRAIPEPPALMLRGLAIAISSSQKKIGILGVALSIAKFLVPMQ